MADLRKIETGSVDCPKCGIHLDGATESNGQETNPKPGDISVCVYCGTFLMFDEEDKKLSLRRLTDEEFITLPDADRVALQRVKNLLREHKKNLPN